MSDKAWFILDHQVVAGTDDWISLTWKDENGDPMDVSGWTNKTYKAQSDKTTDTISVANGSMTVTSSGTGVDDRILIPLSSTATDIDTGRYEHELIADVSSSTRSIFRGTLTINKKIAGA